MLSAHIHVQGSSLPTLFRLSPEEDVVFAEAELPEDFAYIALGHIHRAQYLRGQPHIRYCGSIEKMDLGESTDEKGVVIVDVGPEGRRGEPAVLPMESTPVYVVPIFDPAAELPTLAAALSRPRPALVRIRMHVPGGHRQPRGNACASWTGSSRAGTTAKLPKPDSLTDRLTDGRAGTRQERGGHGARLPAPGADQPSRRDARRRAGAGRGLDEGGAAVIPRRIKVKGFLCYKDEQEVDFDGGNSLWMLSGVNGSGKSAIFDALTFALFGHHRGGGQQVLELINKDCDSLLVEFEFELDNQRYKIKRTVKRRANNTSMGTQQIFEASNWGEWLARREQAEPATNGAPNHRTREDIQPEPIRWLPVLGTENKRDGFDPWVTDHIGLDYDTFTASVLLLQGKAEKLLDSKPEGRRSVLAKIVDLERYEHLFRIADDRRKALEAELKSLSNHLEALREVQPLELEEARQRIALAAEAREQSRLRVEQLQGLEFEARAWMDLQARLSQSASRLKKAEDLLRDAAAIEKDVNRLEELRGPAARSQHCQPGWADQKRRDPGQDANDAPRQPHQASEDAGKPAQAGPRQADHGPARCRDRREKAARRAGPVSRIDGSDGEAQGIRAPAERAESAPSGAGASARRCPGRNASRSAQVNELTQVAQTVPLLVRFQLRREELRQALGRGRLGKERLDQVEAAGKQRSDAVEQAKTQLESAAKELQQANDLATEVRTLVQQAKESLNDLKTLDGSSKVCRACGQALTPGHVDEERSAAARRSRRPRPGSSPRPNGSASLVTPSRNAGRCSRKPSGPWVRRVRNTAPTRPRTSSAGRRGPLAEGVRPGLRRAARG